MAGALAAAQGFGTGPAIGMIDGGVASHPSLAGKSIEQNGFAGAPQPTGHGTAVASLLVGSQGPFRGAATGARLFVADVYGGNRAAGSATSIVRALGWLSGHRPQVINISLVGPPNLLVQRAIQIVEARGIEVVAAVGNDGPPLRRNIQPPTPALSPLPRSTRAGGHCPRPASRPISTSPLPAPTWAAALPVMALFGSAGRAFAAPLAAARLLAAGLARCPRHRSPAGQGPRRPRHRLRCLPASIRESSARSKFHYRGMKRRPAVVLFHRSQLKLP